MPLEGEQLAIEETQVAQEELTAFVEQMNASGEEIEEFKGAFADHSRKPRKRLPPCAMISKRFSESSTLCVPKTCVV